MTRPFRLALLLGAALGSAVLAGTIPAAAQTAGDLAVASCTTAVRARTGSPPKVFKVSGQTMPIVELTAPGNVTYTCFTDASGKVLRLSKDKNTSM